MECEYLDAEHESMINFSKLYYCDLEENFWVFGPLTIFLFLLCLYLLGTTADEFLSSSLEYLAEKLGFSETLSGVTLLALGNGAPDVFASFSAASSPEGLHLSMASISGGILFISTIVSSLIIFSSEKLIGIKRELLFRDAGFLILSIVFLLYFGCI